MALQSRQRGSPHRISAKPLLHLGLRQPAGNSVRRISAVGGITYDVLMIMLCPVGSAVSSD